MDFSFDWALSSPHPAAPVAAPQAAPTITGQPSGGNYDGVTGVTLTVVATGNPAPTYQWFGNVGDTRAAQADYTAGETEIALDDVTGIFVGDMLKTPAGEYLLVTDKGVGSVVVTRAYIGDLADINTSDELELWSTILDATAATYGAAPDVDTDYRVVASNALGRAISNAATVTLLFFPDDFNRANGAPGADWGGIGGGTVEITSNKLRMSAMTGGQYIRAWWVANQIPANWETITVTVKAQLSNANFNNEPAIGICMDDPPTGGVKNAGESIQNGYGIILRPSTFSEKVARWHGGSYAEVFDGDVTVLGTGLTEFQVVVTKMADRVRFQIYWGGSQVGSDIDDTNANRKTGACYIGLNAYASGETVDFDDFDVAYTLAS